MPFNYPKESLGSFGELKQQCNVPEEDERLILGCIHNWKTEGIETIVFINLALVEPLKRIWCLILCVICIFTHPLKINLKRGKDDS